MYLLVVQIFNYTLLQKFFQPAICNIKNNLGKDSVGDDHIKEVCKQMLEDAKLMYKTSQNSRDSSPYDYSDSETSLFDVKIGRGVRCFIVFSTKN